MDQLLSGAALDKRSRKAALGHLKNQREGRPEIPITGGIMAPLHPRLGRPQSALMFRDSLRPEAHSRLNVEVKPSTTVVSALQHFFQKEIHLE